MGFFDEKFNISIIWGKYWWKDWKNTWCSKNIYLMNKKVIAKFNIHILRLTGWLQAEKCSSVHGASTICLVALAAIRHLSLDASCGGGGVEGMVMKVSASDSTEESVLDEGRTEGKNGNVARNYFTPEFILGINSSNYSDKDSKFIPKSKFFLAKH